MKILIARLNHETNTFSPVPTTLESFAPTYGDAAYRNNKGMRTAMAAFIDLAEGLGATLITPLSATANPSGKVHAAAYDALTQWDGTLNVIHIDYKAPKDMSYGEYAYYSFMLFRTRMIYYLLVSDITLWLIESDAVWLRDPSEEVLSTEGDMVTMSDGKPPTKILQGGFQLLRPTKPTVHVWSKLFKQFAKTMEGFRAGANLGDVGSEQLMMNRLIRAEPDLHFTWLDPKHFFPGIYYREVGYNPEAREPKVILNNYIVGNSAKIERAKQHGHWFLLEDGTCNATATRILVAQ